MQHKKQQKLNWNTRFLRETRGVRRVIIEYHIKAMRAMHGILRDTTASLAAEIAFSHDCGPDWRLRSIDSIFLETNPPADVLYMRRI